MPHPDNNNWLSLLVGRPVELPIPKSVDEIADRRARLDFSGLNVDLPEMAEAHERVVLRERDGVPLTAEIYVPKGEGPFPVLLYIHGGGWCVGSPEGVRRPTMRIADEGYVVINLDYGLAPEHPFPWALEDTVYAARWAVAEAERYSGDAGRLIIGGDSAGANLTAAAIVFLNGSGEEIDEADLAGVPVTFKAALLFFGVFDFPLALQEPGSNAGSVEVRWNQAYLGPHFLRLHRSPLVSPVYAPNLDRFPPTYLSCGDEDSLLGHSLVMTKALTQANVPTTLSVVEGVDHAFSYVEHLLPEAVTPEFERIFAWLKKHTRS